VVLADAHGDGWNGATAHIDAYTGPNQWTLFYKGQDDNNIVLSTGQGTSVASAQQTTVIKAELDVGCFKDGCYGFHFTNIGTFPNEGNVTGGGVGAAFVVA
jgi:hypothetical protein